MSFLEDKNNKGNGQRTLKNVCSSTPPTLFKNPKKSLILLFKMRATIILDKNTENAENIFLNFGTLCMYYVFSKNLAQHVICDKWETYILFS